MRFPARVCRDLQSSFLLKAGNYKIMGKSAKAF